MSAEIDLLWREFFGALPTSRVDAFISDEDGMTDALLQVNEGVVAEYHVFVESGGTVVPPYPRIGKGGTIKWT